MGFDPVPKYEPRSSLGARRATTEALRNNETTRSFTGGLSDARAKVTETLPDTRTELQKRFDEIAAELADTKE